MSWLAFTGDTQALPTVPTEGGLTVSAIGSKTAAADEAYIVVLPERSSSSSGYDEMTDEDRQQIRDNLVELGIPQEAVEFENLTRYGTSSISVEVDLDEVAEKREPILEAVAEAIRRYESYGVVYGLSEKSCEAALSLARRDAIPRAERAADDLADALEVERGMVIGALEQPTTASIYYGLVDIGDHQCGSLGSGIVPFDAKPEVEVAVGLQITYSLR